MRRAILAALLVGLVNVPKTFAIVPSPSASFTADGQQFTIPVSKEPDGTYEINNGNPWSQTVAGQFSVMVNGAIDTDPSIDYGIAVTDFGTPSTFSFSFSTPVSVPAGANSVFSSISGSLNDVGHDGASITPTSTFVQTNTVSNGGPATNMGVDVGNSMVLLPTDPPGTHTYGPFNSGPIAGPNGPWNTLTSTAAFSMSGGSDIFTATGHAEIDLPEPASLSLLGLALMPMMRRRRS
jgi:hypothetical protein